MTLQEILHRLSEDAPSIPVQQLASAEPQPPAQHIVLSDSEQRRLAKGCVLLPPGLWQTGLTQDEAESLHTAYKAKNYIARWSRQRNGGYYVAAPGSGLGQR